MYFIFDIDRQSCVPPQVRSDIDKFLIFKKQLYFPPKIPWKLSLLFAIWFILLLYNTGTPEIQSFCSRKQSVYFYLLSSIVPDGPDWLIFYKAPLSYLMEELMYVQAPKGTAVLTSVPPLWDWDLFEQWLSTQSNPDLFIPLTSNVWTTKCIGFYSLVATVFELYCDSPIPRADVLSTEEVNRSSNLLLNLIMYKWKQEGEMKWGRGVLGGTAVFFFSVVHH